MIFEELKLAGAFLVSPELVEDERGYFARTFCQEEFEAHNLVCTFVQNSISFNRKKHTLRGMHFQQAPHEETKVVRCIQGAIYDVIVDLRPDSVTFKKWVGIELSSNNKKSLYIPKCFAHGFITLEDNCEVAYMIDQKYVSDSFAGFNYSDHDIGISWPFKPSMISARDLNLASMCSQLNT